MKHLLVLAALCLASTAPAAVNPTTAGDWQLHEHDDSYYTETWTAIVRADTGHILYLNFLYTNIGVVSGRSGLNAALTLPGGQGKPYKVEFDKEDLKVSGSTVKLHESSFTLQGRDAHLVTRQAGLETDLVFKGWIDGVKFGDGKVWLDKDKEGFVQTFFHIPRADVTGSLKVGGQTVQITGAGYVDHWVQNALAGDYSTQWSTARMFTPEQTFILMSWQYDEDHGKGMLRRTLYLDRQRLLADSSSAKVSIRGSKKDPKGYRYATRLGVSQDGPPRLVAEFESKRLHERAAVMEEMGWAQRQVASMVAGNPIIYRMDGTGFVRVEAEGQAPVLVEGPTLLESVMLQAED